MKARILRGSDRIGGSLVELERDGARIVLDVGLPLEFVPYRDLHPDVEGLWAPGDGSLRAVFVTHGHPDHYGLADLVEPSVPIYMGRAAKAVIDEAAFFNDRDPGFSCAGHLEDRVPIQTGPFTVTPHLVDHSGFDSYGLLVEAGGSSLFYSGDIRFHGRKSDRMKGLASRLPDDLDCLLIEGTNFGRPARNRFLSEHDLEDHLATSFGGVEGAAVCLFSGQNIDRLVTVFRASKRSDRTFVFDLYGATIAAATGRDTIPLPSWDEVRVYVRRAERVRVLEAEQFDRVKRLGSNRIYLDEIAADPSRFVLAVRTSAVGELARDGCLEGARAFWSQWAGYLKPEDPLVGQLEDLDVGIETAHVSGHATTEDLIEFATQVNATRTVPIHTNSPSFPEDRVGSLQSARDGAWWEVDREGPRGPAIDGEGK